MMAYTDEQIKKIHELSLKTIEEKELVTIEELVSFLPISKTSFYKYFQMDSDEMNAIKDKIDSVKIKTRIGLRKKMYDSNSSSNLIALYKLVGTEEERKILSQQDLTSDGEKLQSSVFVYQIPSNGRDKEDYYDGENEVD